MSAYKTLHWRREHEKPVPRIKPVPPFAKDRRVLIATYHGQFADWPVQYPLWIYKGLGQCSRLALSQAKERGYVGRRKLTFKIVHT